MARAVTNFANSPGIFMSITISSAFDAGNIRVVEQRGAVVYVFG